MAEKKGTAATPEDELDSLLASGDEDAPTPEEGQSEQPSPLKGVVPTKAPWGPEMFASAAHHRSRFAGEWDERVAEADDETIAETFALGSRLMKAMRAELVSRLAPE